MEAKRKKDFNIEEEERRENNFMENSMDTDFRNLSI
jgi:hypothetical protein